MEEFTAQEREWVLDSVIGSQALAGVTISREDAARLLDAVEEEWRAAYHRTLLAQGWSDYEARAIAYEED